MKLDTLDALLVVVGFILPGYLVATAFRWRCRSRAERPNNQEALLGYLGLSLANYIICSWLVGRLLTNHWYDRHLGWKLALWATIELAAPLIWGGMVGWFWSRGPEQRLLREVEELRQSAEHAEHEAKLAEVELRIEETEVKHSELEARMRNSTSGWDFWFYFAEACPTLLQVTMKTGESYVGRFGDDSWASPVDLLLEEVYCLVDDTWQPDPKFEGIWLPMSEIRAVHAVRVLLEGEPEEEGEENAYAG